MKLCMYYFLSTAAVMSRNFSDANITNIDKTIGNWLIHCKYKKGAKKEENDEQTVDGAAAENIDNDQ